MAGGNSKLMQNNVNMSSRLELSMSGPTETNQPTDQSKKTSYARPCLQAGRVTLVLGLPWHSHISSYFQRRIYKAARVTLALG